MCSGNQTRRTSNDQSQRALASKCCQMPRVMGETLHLFQRKTTKKVTREKDTHSYHTEVTEWKKMGVEWKWAVCHKELLHYKRACPWKKETKSYGRFSFQAPVCCQNYWRAGMNEKHNEWKLSHLLSLTVCKLSVNRRAQHRCPYKLCFFCSICPCCFISGFLTATVYHLHYQKVRHGERVVYGKMGEIQRRAVRIYWDVPCVWLHMHAHNRMYLHEFVRGATCLQAPTWTFGNIQCFELAATQAHRHTLTAAATHLHDKGLVNYLRSLIWSIQESCIRLQGQSEPLDFYRPSLFMRTTERDQARGRKGEKRGSKR